MIEIIIDWFAGLFKGPHAPVDDSDSNFQLSPPALKHEQTRRRPKRIRPLDRLRILADPLGEEFSIEYLEEEAEKPVNEDGLSWIPAAVLTAVVAKHILATKHGGAVRDQIDNATGELMRKWMNKPVRVPTDTSAKGYVVMTRGQLLQRKKFRGAGGDDVMDRVREAYAKERRRVKEVVELSFTKKGAEKKLQKQQAKRGREYDKKLANKQAKSGEAEDWLSHRVEYDGPRGRQMAMRRSILKQKNHPEYQRVAREYEKLKKRLGYDPLERAKALKKRGPVSVADQRKRNIDTNQRLHKARKDWKEKGAVTRRFRTSSK